MDENKDYGDRGNRRNIDISYVFSQTVHAVTNYRF
jgi:hypothetical protein